MAKKAVQPMTAKSVMAELKKLGSDQTVKTYRRHGAEGDMFGVKIGDLKPFVKRMRGNQDLALELWDTNNSDAMYLAALVADGSLMNRKQLDLWAKTAWWYMLSEYSVPFVAAEHKDAFAIAKKWSRSRNESIATSGWCTYASAIGIREDDAIPIDELADLLAEIPDKIHHAPNRVRYCMNHFVIAVGSYVKPLLKNAKSIAKEVGKVHVDMGGTACKVPLATDYIKKVESMGRVGKKRSSAKC